MYRNFALLENHAKHRSRHYCSDVRVAIVAALGTRRIVRLPARKLRSFLLSNARVREALSSARAAHLLPVSRPRCQDGAGDRPPERGRPLCNSAAPGAAARAEEAEDKEVRPSHERCRAFFSFRATRARARDRLGGTASRFLALTTPRRSPSPRVSLHAGSAGPRPMATRARSATTPPRFSGSQRNDGRGACARPRRTRSWAGAAADPRGAQRRRWLERQDQLRQRGWGRGDERRRLRRRLGRGRHPKAAARAALRFDFHDFPAEDGPSGRRQRRGQGGRAQVGRTARCSRSARKRRRRPRRPARRPRPPRRRKQAGASRAPKGARRNRRSRARRKLSRKPEKDHAEGPGLSFPRTRAMRRRSRSA